MPENNRISSIDIMRGLTLVLMLIVNDLYMPGVPSWLGHMPADFDGMGLADWVFPGFLFMVGMAIPFSIGKRITKMENTLHISLHILVRTASLLIIGVLMLNSGRVDGELTGIGKNLWAILMYIAVFLIWNSYKKHEKNFLTITGLRLAGAGMLIILVFLFRSGELVNNGSLITSWWGILGLIGWGYLVSAFLYLAVRENIKATAVVFLFFLGLNILSKAGMLSFLDPVNPYLGVIYDGNVPLIVIAGLLTALVLRKYPGQRTTRALITIAAMGAICIIAGFFLRKWFIISKIQATPSWGMICNGISMILFAFIFWLTDVKKHTRWAFLIKPAGENSLTTYLAPNIIYHLIWSINLPVLIYKQSDYPLVVITGSVIWAILMVQLTALLVRFNIKLKL